MPHPTTEPTPVTVEALRAWPLPEPTGGKNARGSILVIGGSTETLGAVLLAAEAAMRAGAGKLQVATVASLAPFAAAALPEALVRALPETSGGAISAKAADVVRDLAEGLLLARDGEEADAARERVPEALGLLVDHGDLTRRAASRCWAHLKACGPPMRWPPSWDRSPASPPGSALRGH